MNAGRRLLRALQASAREAGCAVAITVASEQHWASATFVGTQHTIAVEGKALGLGRWLDGLGEGSIAVPGHVVAELAVERGVEETMLRVLTLEA